MATTLTLRFPADDRHPASSGLKVVLAPVSQNELSIHLAVAVDSVKFSAETLCYAYDLAEFARELETLHTRYDGSARFANQLSDFALILTLTNKTRGIISVTAYYTLHSFGDEINQLEFEFPFFQLDQSYLPGMIADIREFLAETGVDTTHPFLHSRWT